jgi:ADP-ribosylation factor GTPase-activating protein 1
MDSWSPDQLRKMQKGGNNKLNSFLKTYGIDKHEDIGVKYNTEAAQVNSWARLRKAVLHVARSASI